MENELKIEVEVIWHIIIEPDYEVKKKPPFPPKIKVYLTVPDCRYRIIRHYENSLKSYMSDGFLKGQRFGFIIKYDPDKNSYTQIVRNVRNLNRKFHLNIDEDFRIISIKNSYTYGYFKEGNNVDNKSKEKIILSKEYIEDRMSEIKSTTTS